MHDSPRCQLGSRLRSSFLCTPPDPDESPLLSHIRSIVGLVGVVIFWVGVWNLVDLYCFGPYTPQRDVILVVVSFFLLCLFGYQFLNVGMWREQMRYKCFYDRFEPHLRTVLTIPLTIALWTGLFNLIDCEYSDTQYWINTEAADGLRLVIGFLLMCATGTVIHNSWLDDDGAPALNFTRNWIRVVRDWTKLLFATLALAFFWVGFWNLADNNVPSSILRNCCYTLIGIAVMIVTRSLVGNAALDNPSDDGEPEPPPLLIQSAPNMMHKRLLDTSFRAAEKEEKEEGPRYGCSCSCHPEDPYGTHVGCFGHDGRELRYRDFCTLHGAAVVLRSLVALAAGNFFWTGLWDFLDRYIYPGSWKRELVYVSIGLVTMVLTCSLKGQTSLPTLWGRVDRQAETKHPLEGLHRYHSDSDIRGLYAEIDDVKPIGITV